MSDDTSKIEELRRGKEIVTHKIIIIFYTIPILFIDELAHYFLSMTDF